MLGVVLRLRNPLLALGAMILALASLLPAGCGEATSILLRVSSTSLDPGTDVDTLEFSIRGETTGTVVDRSFAIASPWPHSLSIRPGPQESSRVTVTVRARRGGLVVAEEIVTESFVRGVDIIVDVSLGAGVPADAGNIDGGARDGGSDAGPLDGGVDASADAGSDAGSSDANTDANTSDGGCLDATDCDDAIACTTDACVTGRCLHTPDDAVCAVGTTCDVVMGCPARVCATAADCDDGLFCNGTESCNAATMACVAGTSPCDDGDDCTDDPCVEASDMCRHTTRDADGDGAGDATCTAVGGVPATDCDDARMDVFPGAPDVCDGLDNDCTGGCDSRSTCCRGSTDPCMTSCGTMGARTCGVACSWSVCSPPAESCNGVDDDCNGACDDGFACCRGSSGSCTTACGSTGTQVCGSDCTFGSCAPPVETCNGRDDDCDGMCDDGSACCAGTSTPCITACGSMGSRVCRADCTASPTCTAPAEICNDLDENCNGMIDETFECRVGATGALPTSCGSIGPRTCSGSCAFGACVPPTEICYNVIDDNCDGFIDEACPACGACTGAATVSAPGGRYTVTTSASATAGTCGGTGAEGVLSFTLAAASDVFITTHQGALDTILYVRNCSCSGPEVACNDNADGLLSSTLQLNDLAAGTYNVFVDTRTPASQAIPVDIYIGSPVQTSDTCSDPFFLNARTITLTGNNCGYRNDFDNVTVAGATNCPLAESGDSSDQVVYFYLPTPQTVTVSGCAATAFDSVLYMRGVCTDASAGAQEACNDDGCGMLSGMCDTTASSSFSQLLPAGLHYLVIDGYGAVGSACSCGPFTLNLTGI